MFEWGSRGAGDRGVSHVLGVVLLASAVIIGAVLIVQVGQQTIGDVNDDANVELAEEVLLSVDQSFQRSDTSESVEVPDRVRSDVAVTDDATYNLTLNSNSTCSTGNRSLQTLQYQENGQEVGYQGGGVWRMTESGATMSSPPAVNYDKGALSVSFANISGQQIGGSSVAIRSNTTANRSHEAALQTALFTEATYEGVRNGSWDSSSPSTTCAPSQVTNATLTIENSSYARAWADWAQSAYDDKYVKVTPSSVEPGETIDIRFALGNVSDPEFEVQNMSVREDPSDDQKALVNATIRNTGGLQDTQEIRLNRSGASDNATATVTLTGGDSARVSKSIDADSGVYNFTVASEQDKAYKLVNYTAVPGSPSLNITSASIPATARLNQVPESNVTVENNGSMTAEQNVTLLVNGSVNATQHVTVHPGNTRTVDFDSAMPTSENGTYDIEVATDDDTYSQYSDDGHYFVVGDVGVFEVTSVSPPGGVKSGDTVTIEATVKNTGNIRKSDAVKIHIKNESDTTVESKEKTLTLNGTNSGSEKETVTLTSGPLTAPSYSNYTYIVETPDDRSYGTFTVGASAPPVFDITGLGVDNPVEPENKTEVSFNVTNTGGTAGSQTLRIGRDWGADKSTDEQLDPGESTTVTQTVTAPSEDGLYRVNFTTGNQTAWRILNVRSNTAVERDGGGMTTTERVNATIELKGAELEGSNGYQITHTKVDMDLVVNNQSGDHEIPLWRDVGYDFEDGDVNGPHAERRLINDDYPDPYEFTKTFEANSNFSVTATSYHCYETTYTDIRFKIDGTNYYTKRCSSPGSVRISTDESSTNADILADGEVIPGYGQAGKAQRKLTDMLGEQRLTELDNGSARLNLADGEFVYLYELSQDNANPENAYGYGDPDYNDAVVIFRTNSIENEVAEPRFSFVDVDVPARTPKTDDTEATVTVKNVGTAAGSAKLTPTFDGSTAETQDTEIGVNETAQFNVELATASKTPGQSYQYRFNLTNPNRSESATGKQWGGNIYVGDIDEQFMQVDSVRATSTIDNDESANATVDITNVGGEGGTAEIKLYAKNTDDAGSTFTVSDSATTSLLTNGDTEQVTLSLPSDRGNHTYYVQTRNSTSAKQSFFVGRSSVVVNDTQGINIGAQTYNTATLIERNGGAERITVEVNNEGTVGDEREVALTVKNKSDGTTVYTGTENVTAGSGDLTGSDAYPAWAGYDTDLDPGYYTYEVTVYNDTASGSVDDTATGEIYLKDVDESGATTNDSPISIDSDTITIGS
ncbi:DUF7289 family protein [Haloarcula sp. CGMCC 1.6347]|uniref:DUF7289 family protein n=1 Tax=Haloarcula sp. CGMCC 1.6347 TaxID=3111455 RepID=UPI00300E8965